VRQSEKIRSFAFSRRASPYFLLAVFRSAPQLSELLVEASFLLFLPWVDRLVYPAEALFALVTLSPPRMRWGSRDKPRYRLLRQFCLFYRGLSKSHKPIQCRKVLKVLVVHTVSAQRKSERRIHWYIEGVQLNLTRSLIGWYGFVAVAKALMPNWLHTARKWPCSFYHLWCHQLIRWQS